MQPRSLSPRDICKKLCKRMLTMRDKVKRAKFKDALTALCQRIDDARTEQTAIAEKRAKQFRISQAVSAAASREHYLMELQVLRDALGTVERGLAHVEAQWQAWKHHIAQRAEVRKVGGKVHNLGRGLRKMRKEQRTTRKEQGKARKEQRKSDEKAQRLMHKVRAQLNALTVCFKHFAEAAMLNAHGTPPADLLGKLHEALAPVPSSSSGSSARAEPSLPSTPSRSSRSSRFGPESVSPAPSEPDLFAVQPQSPRKIREPRQLRAPPLEFRADLLFGNAEAPRGAYAAASSTDEDEDELGFV